MIEDPLLSKKNSRWIVKLTPVDGLTLIGVLLACSSIGLVLEGQFAYGLAVLLLAMLADAFDGILARKYGLERDFGRYLDGFVDVFDYLVAPSLFLYLWGFSEWYQSFLLIIFIMGGIVRLSVFNDVGNLKDESDGLSYWGMPVFWSVLGLAILFPLSFLFGKAFIFQLLCLLLPAYSLAMNYNGRFFKFKNPIQMLVVLLGGAFVFFLMGYYQCNQPKESNILFGALLLPIIPVIVGGVLHMLVVSKDWFKFLTIPVNRSMFGANKTLRGFVVMPLLTIPGVYLMQALMSRMESGEISTLADYSPVYIGTVLGLAYILAELPNSFIKRRMGAAPGEAPEKFGVFFKLMDQLDSVIGCSIAYVIFFSVPVDVAIKLVVLSPVIAYGIKQILYLANLKKTAY